MKRANSKNLVEFSGSTRCERIEQCSVCSSISNGFHNNQPCNPQGTCHKLGPKIFVSSLDAQVVSYWLREGQEKFHLLQECWHRFFEKRNSQGAFEEEVFCSGQRAFSGKNLRESEWKLKVDRVKPSANSRTVLRTQKAVVTLDDRTLRCPTRAFLRIFQELSGVDLTWTKSKIRLEHDVPVDICTWKKRKQWNFKFMSCYIDMWNMDAKMRFFETLRKWICEID